MHNLLQVENVSFFYGVRQVLKDINVTVQKGSVLCILGPSGTGKSTLLKVIAGILTPSSGRIILDGQDRTHVPIHERKELGYVFQSGDGLFPHLSVYQNVAFPFSHGHRSLSGNRHWQDAVMDILNCVGLVENKDSMIWKLSGGMAQRVALARSLVYEPDILLLDEPLGSLDNALKAELTDLLRTLQRRLGTTFVYVTHDEREALAFGTHIAVMNEGQIEQQAETATLISQPRTASVARLIGGWNVLEYKASAAGALDDGEKMMLAYAQQRVGGAWSGNTNVLAFPIAQITTGITGQSLSQANDSATLKVSILRMQTWYDRKLIVTQTASGKTITATVVGTTPLEEGQVVNLTIRKEHIHAFQE